MKVYNGANNKVEDYHQIASSSFLSPSTIEIYGRPAQLYNYNNENSHSNLNYYSSVNNINSHNIEISQNGDYMNDYGNDIYHSTSNEYYCKSRHYNGFDRKASIILSIIDVNFINTYYFFIIARIFALFMSGGTSAIRIFLLSAIVTGISGIPSPKAIDLILASTLDAYEPNYCNQSDLIVNAGLFRAPLGQFLGFPCSNEFFHCRWQSDGYRTYKKNCRAGLVYDTLGTQNCNYDYNVKGCAISSDSANCKENDFTCPLSETCVNISQRCDGKYDCALEEDEQNCPMCKAGEFACIVSEQCIPMSGRCNGIKECQDGTDEQNCEGCGQGKFFCRKSSKCISAKERCDGLAQCPHGEDEMLCKKSALVRMFVCEDRRVQVPRETVCDGMKNCPDGSDEKYCNRATPVHYHNELALNQFYNETLASTALQNIVLNNSENDSAPFAQMDQFGSLTFKEEETPANNDETLNGEEQLSISSTSATPQINETIFHVDSNFGYVNEEANATIAANFNENSAISQNKEHMVEGDFEQLNSQTVESNHTIVDGEARNDIGSQYQHLLTQYQQQMWPQQNLYQTQLQPNYGGSVESSGYVQSSPGMYFNSSFAPLSTQQKPDSSFGTNRPNWSPMAEYSDSAHFQNDQNLALSDVMSEYSTDIKPSEPSENYTIDSQSEMTLKRKYEAIPSLNVNSSSSTISTTILPPSTTLAMNQLNSQWWKTNPLENPWQRQPLTAPIQGTDLQTNPLPNISTADGPINGSEQELKPQFSSSITSDITPIQCIKDTNDEMPEICKLKSIEEKEILHRITEKYGNARDLLHKIENILLVGGNLEDTSVTSIHSTINTILANTTLKPLNTTTQRPKSRNLPTQTIRVTRKPNSLKWHPTDKQMNRKIPSYPSI